MFDRVLKVVFVNDNSITVFDRRLCPWVTVDMQYALELRRWSGTGRRHEDVGGRGAKVHCAMLHEAIWHDWDPLYRVLKVAFVDKERIAVFVYRLCLECGVTMDRSERGEDAVWHCTLCGCEAREL